MNAFKRIHDIFGSNVNHALDKLEDPAKMIRYTIVEMEKSLDKAKASAAETKANIAARETELKTQKEAMGRWDVRAQLAVKNGVLQLSDVAGPAVGEHLALHLFREYGEVLVAALHCHPLAEVVRQKQDVLSSFTKRWDEDDLEAQAVQKVLHELALTAHLLQICIGGPDYPHICLMGDG